MSCCSQVYDIGCVNHCSTIDTGFDATQTGVHTFEFKLSANAWQTYDVSITSGNDIEIPSGLINEGKPIDFKLKQPDGTYYAWSTGVTCARIATGIYGEIVT